MGPVILRFKDWCTLLQKSSGDPRPPDDTKNVEKHQQQKHLLSYCSSLVHQISDSEKQNSWRLVLIPKSGAIAWERTSLWPGEELYQEAKPGPTECSFNFRAPLQNRNSTWQDQPWTSQRVRNEMPPHNVQSSARSMMHLAIQQADLQPSPSNARESFFLTHTTQKF